MTSPTPPIALVEPAQTTARFGESAPLDAATIAALRQACPDTTTDRTARVESSRDWWPIGIHWALAGKVGAVAAVVCRPVDAGQVAAVLRTCHEHRVPVTAAGGRSGVCGASVPLSGGVLLDLTGMAGLVAVDDESLVIDVLPGTFGPDLERDLGARGLTLGHWPQSMDISTVGGWLACRGAGQYSTRYGKIEDMVVGLDVALADGRQIVTGGSPRAAAGPDLTQVFVGSEGTLGVITKARLRVHPAPPAERRAAFGFPSWDAGLQACRRILRRGATPAVLRLYDEAESKRSHNTDGSVAVLLVLDEGEPALIDGVLAVVAEECTDAQRLDTELVERWLGHRNDVSALEALSRKGLLVDTLEIAGLWADLPAIYRAATAALLAVPSALVATAHLSHSYADGACLYFTFAASPTPDQIEATYVALWDAGTTAVLEAGGNLSHHHGVGLNRARFVPAALGPAHEVLTALKGALDPAGILNPGKLGLPNPFGGASVAVTDQLDPRALYEGGIVAAVIVVPAGVVGRIVSDRDDPPGWRWLLVVVVLIGLVLGAGIAVWRQERRLPLTHGIVTAVGVYVVVQLVGIIVRLASGDSVNWSVVASSLLLSLMAGLVGGLLGSFMLSQGVRPER